MNGDETRHKVVKNYHGLLVLSNRVFGAVPAINPMLGLIVTGYHQAENERGYATLVINEGVLTMAMMDTEIGYYLGDQCMSISGRT